MTPHLLRLRGFRGIRDGLGREELTLDLDRFAGDAALIALVGRNGRGKTTILDNLHPYLTMPSRASAAGPGGFSYYDHVYLPESEKELVWSTGGQRYRTQVVIRSNGRRRTEAFLFADASGHWVPATLADGTVSDGKVETYARCVAELCGQADTFFASMFCAQGRRALSQYRNAEVKALLADLLGQDELRGWSQRAGETVRLLKAGLSLLRQQLAAEDQEAARLEEARARLADAPARARRCAARCQEAATALRDAQRMHASFEAEWRQSEGVRRERERLQAQRTSLVAQGQSVLRGLDEQERREAGRLEALRRRVEQRSLRARERREDLERQAARLRDVLRQAPAVLRAVRRLSLAERVEAGRDDAVARARQAVREWQEASSALVRNGEQRADLEQAAGQAALAAEDLQRRLGLTAQVPCAGSDLQGRCRLLGDARRAKALIPGARAELARLATSRRELEEQRDALRARVGELAHAPDALDWAEYSRDRARARGREFAARAARAGDIERARRALVDGEQALAALKREHGGMLPDEREETEAIASARRALRQQRQRRAEEFRNAVSGLDDTLRALPVPDSGDRLARSAEALTAAEEAADAVQADQATATREAEALRLLDSQARSHAQRRRMLRRRVERVETALGTWTLFGRCMGNDGLIALAIDDAGPALAGLANALPLACYGPRFTLSIRTQVENAKGEAREGFEIEIHDAADGGQPKSVLLASGGERVWIDACLTRAVALYLAHQGGGGYETLFSDEADGALDPERKRMWMAMKREVLRLGGYAREFFISQTPELAAMADAVIDLDAMASAP